MLSSLVMLLPFGTSKSIFSNAMAIEEYDTDPYMNYAMYISNEYEDESGNNNYEPEYQSYENDNYANSELTKKIKCNNINSNFNGVDSNTKR